MIVALPKMLSARTVAQRLGRERKWVLARCQESASSRFPWPGTTKTGNAWRVPEAALLDWVAQGCPRRPPEAGALGVHGCPGCRCAGLPETARAVT